MTEGDLWPDRAQRSGRAARRSARWRAAARSRAAAGARLRAQRAAPGAQERQRARTAAGDRHARDACCAGSGYHVAMKGKWHLSKPVNGERWGAGDPERLERDYGFAEWEPPDAGGDTKAENFGGGNAGRSRRGLGRGLHPPDGGAGSARGDLPEPFCLVFSLVNPHDVLGYPGFLRAAAATRSERVPRARRAAAADARGGPAREAGRAGAVEARHGQLPRSAARTAQAQQDYVDFYAHLHRVVDEKIGRLLTALGPPDDPGSLRSRTVILRTSDHGEMGLSHGGLRQKIFNAYEETIRVPLVVSNPRMFPQPRESDALDLAARRRADLPGPRGRRHRARAARRARPRPAAARRDAQSVRDAVLFTYDDHQAGTALQDGAGQPNRIRCVRDERWKYAVYLDPARRARARIRDVRPRRATRYETRNLLDRSTGARAQRRARARAPAPCRATRRAVPRQRHADADPARCRVSSDRRPCRERRMKPVPPALVVSASRDSRWPASARRRRAQALGRRRGRVELFFAFDDPCSADRADRPRRARWPVATCDRPAGPSSSAGSPATPPSSTSAAMRSTTPAASPGARPRARPHASRWPPRTPPSSPNGPAGAPQGPRAAALLRRGRSGGCGSTGDGPVQRGGL